MSDINSNIKDRFRRLRTNAVLVWNRRLRIIDIVDTDSVPLLNVSSDRELNTAIRNRSIELLQQAHKDNNDMEVGALMKNEYPYNILWNKNGDIQHVYMDDRMLNIKTANRSCTFIHNHPQSGGLSWRDITNFIYDRRLQNVVAVGNRGDRSYIMIKNANYNEHIALSHIRDINNKNNTMFEKTSEFMQYLDEIGLDYITNRWYET